MLTTRPALPIDDVTRRDLLKGVGALLVTAACDRQAGQRSAPSPAATAHSIEHKFGTTEITGTPERVVTVGFAEEDFVLALGVVPVGVREFLGPYAFATRPWAPDELTGSPPQVVGAEELDLEGIAALDPDVILGVYSFMTGDAYAPLARIAPTVAQPGEFPDGGVPWQEQARITGRALGRVDQAEELVARVEQQFARARAAHPQLAGRTATLLLVFEGAFYVLEPADRRFAFFAGLDLVPPEHVGEISREQAALIDGDVVVVLSDLDDLADDPLLRRLDAVREGRVVHLPFAGDVAGAIGAGSPLSLPFALERAVPLLADALSASPPPAPTPSP